ncbi:PRC-barrel domain containing protein [Pseudogemmobacter faecipullorum]|uniref:PRC-barrel domain containing protein n=1 Tax=Pseudogemmobacter faecipullorum TaxID=2755041 RepID=A0ABS8CT82_9RHOB|nr:PRC-barrel domain containing protein [Pseudogemmobacter faecipullorum]MCB5412025.1 PRC-barrel domain containing protein [Pseudogemmobacter faecipullorum]
MDHARHIRLAETDRTGAMLNSATLYGPGDERTGPVSEVHGQAKTEQVILDIGGYFGIGARPVAGRASDLSFMRDKNGRVHAVI